MSVQFNTYQPLPPLERLSIVETMQWALFQPCQLIRRTWLNFTHRRLLNRTFSQLRKKELLPADRKAANLVYTFLKKEFSKPLSGKGTYQLGSMGAEEFKNRYLPTALQKYSFLQEDFAASKLEAAYKHLQRLETHCLSKQLKKGELTDEEFNAIRTLAQTIQNVDDGADIDETAIKEKIEGLLRYADSNPGFNKRLQDHQSHLIGDDNAVKAAIDTLITYSHNTGRIARFDKPLQKANAILSHSHLNNNDNAAVFPENQKLYLQEVRLLESLAKMHSIFKRFAWTGVPSDIQDKVTIAHNTVESMLNEAERESSLTSGSVIIYDKKNDEDYLGRGRSCIVRFVYKYILRMNSTHLAIGLHNHNTGHDEESHMWGSPLSKHTVSRRTLGNRCFKTVKVRFDRLVTESEHQDQLKQHYGENWPQELEQRYVAIVNELHHNNPRFQAMKNTKWRMFMAAMGVRFSPFPPPWHKRIEMSSNAICSEFVLKTSLQCLNKLNDQINEEIGTPNPENNPIQFLQPPVRKHRRLNRVLPGEIVARSVKKGIYEEIEPPQVIQNYIHFHQYTLAKQSKF